VERRIFVDSIDEHVGIKYQHSLFVQHVIERLAISDIDPETSASPSRTRRQRFRVSSGLLGHCQTDLQCHVCEV